MSDKDPVISAQKIIRIVEEIFDFLPYGEKTFTAGKIFVTRYGSGQVTFYIKDKRVPIFFLRHCPRAVMMLKIHYNDLNKECQEVMETL